MQTQHNTTEMQQQLQAQWQHLGDFSNSRSQICKDINTIISISLLGISRENLIKYTCRRERLQNEILLLIISIYPINIHQMLVTWHSQNRWKIKIYPAHTERAKDINSPHSTAGNAAVGDSLSCLSEAAV